MKPVIFDTGPLVAWFCPKDTHHNWARQTFANIPTGGFICEAVLAEACHLIAKDGISPEKVVQFVEQGELTPFFLGGELPALRQLLRRYADTPMDFADACVVRMAEIHANSPVCTTDSDFLIYRKNEREAISLMAPFTPT